MIAASPQLSSRLDPASIPEFTACLPRGLTFLRLHQHADIILSSRPVVFAKMLSELSRAESSETKKEKTGNFRIKAEAVLSSSTGSPPTRSEVERCSLSSFLSHPPHLPAWSLFVELR